MNRRFLLFGFLAVAGAGAFFWYNSVYGWYPVADPSDEFGLEFRFLGCNDWPENRSYETSIQSLVSGSSITYQVTDPAGCGYSIRDPQYKLAGDTLNLSYDLYTPSGEVAACICEYKSEFRFRKNPKASRAIFDHTGG